MPTQVRRVLERAIGARRRCADWLEEANVEAKKLNEKHLHLIDALQSALDLLRPNSEDQGNGRGEGG